MKRNRILYSVSTEDLQTYFHVHWSNTQNQRRLLDKLGKKLGYMTKDDWYSIYSKDILDNGAGHLLLYFHYSPSLLIFFFYSEHKWQLWKFHAVPRRFWDSKENERRFLDWLGEKLGYKRMDDWYQIDILNISKNGGLGLITYKYNSSPYNLLTSVYSEHNWIIFNFSTSLSRHLNWKTNANHLIQNIKSLDDWYRLSQMVKFPMIQIWKNIIQQSYPNHKWDTSQMQFKIKQKSDSNSFLL